MIELDLDLLKTLLSIQAPSGRENNISSFIISVIPEDVFDYELDLMGNLIVFDKEKGIDSNTLFLSAHMDEIGFVGYKTVDNRLFVFSQTKMSSESIIGKRIKCLNGISGVVQNIIDENGSELLYIELDEKTKSEELSLPIFATFAPGFEKEKDLIRSKSLDNRIGCYILLEFMKLNVRKKLNVAFVFTTQEELGNRGAKYLLKKYSFNHIINIDTTPVFDDKKCTSVEFGKGVAIKCCDSGSLINESIYIMISKIATECGIPFQLEIVNRGSTDLRVYCMNSSSSAGISIPCRNGHTSCEEICINDVLAAIQLLTETII